MRESTNNVAPNDGTAYYDCFFRRAYKLFEALTNPVFLAFLGMLLLIISTMSCHMGVDEGIWSYMARVWAENGILPYSGTIDNKPPGIFLLFYMSHLLFGTNVWFPRLLGILASLGTSVCLYFLIRRLANHTAGIIGMVLYISVTPSRMFHGTYTSHTEWFMVFFVVLAFLLLVLSNTWNGRRYYAAIIGAGVSAGTAVVFKQVAILDCIALLIFTGYFLKIRGDGKSIKKIFGLIITGIVLANILSVIPLLASGGSLADYLRISWVGLLQGREMNISILQRFGNIIPAWSHNALIVPYLGIAGFVLHRKRLRQLKVPVTILLVWLALDFIGINAAGTYYKHQYRQILPPLCIIFGILFDFLATELGIKDRAQTFFKTRGKIVLGIILATFICYVPFEKNYEKGFKTILRGRENPNKQLGLYMNQITENDQYIYIFGRGMNQILSCSGRLAPSPYFNWFFFSYPKALEQVQRDINDKRPAFILLKPGKDNYRKEPGSLEREVPGWLQCIVDREYVQSETKANFDLYIRKTSKSFDTKDSG